MLSLLLLFPLLGECPCLNLVQDPDPPVTNPASSGDVEIGIDYETGCDAFFRLTVTAAASGTCTEGPGSSCGALGTKALFELLAEVEGPAQVGFFVNKGTSGAGVILTEIMPSAPCTPWAESLPMELACGRYSFASAYIVDFVAQVVVSDQVTVLVKKCLPD